MKHLRQLCAAALLTIALAFTALGGDIDLPGIPAPTSNSSVTAPGDMGAPGASDKTIKDSPSSNWLKGATLDLWQQVLSLF